MSRNGYTEEEAVKKLSKRGVKFANGVAEVRSGSLGINYLGMLDYLEKNHKYIVKYIKGK